MLRFPGESGPGTIVPGTSFGTLGTPHSFPIPREPIFPPPPVQPVAPQPPPAEPVQPTPPQQPDERYFDGGFMVARSTTVHGECTANNDGSWSCSGGVSTTF